MIRITSFVVSISLYICFGLFGNAEHNQIISDVVQNWDGNNPTFVQIESLKSRTNENYKVSLTSRSYFFRFSNRANKDLDCSLEREWQISSLISKFKISPWVMHYSPKNGVLVTDFIDTKSQLVNLHDQETMQRASRVISSLHNIYYRLATDYNPYNDIENYFEKAIELAVFLPDELHETILPAIRTLRDALPSLKIDKTFAHLNLHARNMLDDGNKLWLIDWEYAAMADPFFDLATLASKENFSDFEMNEFLGYYLERNPTQDESDHFYKMRILADTRWALWSYIQAKTSSLDEPFEKMGDEYMQNILLRINIFL